MTAAAAIEVRGAGKSFAGRPCLRDVDLHVGTGELIGLVGPNGAGKSTLLRCLVGLLQRDGGAMTVGGHDPRTDSLAIRRQCSYLPGETSIYLGMTGAEFLDFALAFHGARNQRLLDRLLAGFGLPLQRKVRTYSAGMKQKLALCAALGPDLPLYLLDEPDRALDATVRLFLRDVLHELHVEGRTILLSSHHLAEVESLANRVVFLVDGAIVPHQQVTAARARLHHRVRLRLQRPIELPDGAERLPDDPDGTLVLQCHGEAAAWMARVPAAAIDTAEIGAVRLEDLYRLLTGIDQPGGRA